MFALKRLHISMAAIGLGLFLGGCAADATDDSENAPAPDKADQALPQTEAEAAQPGGDENVGKTSSELGWGGLGWGGLGWGGAGLGWGGAGLGWGAPIGWGGGWGGGWGRGWGFGLGGGWGFGGVGVATTTAVSSTMVAGTPWLGAGCIGLCGVW